MDSLFWKVVLLLAVIFAVYFVAQKLMWRKRWKTWPKAIGETVGPFEVKSYCTSSRDSKGEETVDRGYRVYVNYYFTPPGGKEEFGGRFVTEFDYSAKEQTKAERFAELIGTVRLEVIYDFKNPDLCRARLPEEATELIKLMRGRYCAEL